jgi:cytochrome c oxidase subunit II
MSDTFVDRTAGAPAPAPAEPRHFRNAMIIWVVISVVGVILWIILAPFILPQGASNLDAADDLTLTVFTAIAVPVAAFVFVFLAYSLIFFRSRGRPTEDAVPLKPRPGLQITWLAITSALCLFLFWWGLVAFYEETAANPPPSTLTIRVTAQQWAWTFDYTNYSISNQGQVIEVPVNRPVQFLVTSADVLHGFAVRSLGVRIDANPGEWTSTPVVTPTVIGNYTVNCVEMCGLLHSYM